jgi:hypothetical protein
VPHNSVKSANISKKRLRNSTDVPELHPDRHGLQNPARWPAFSSMHVICVSGVKPWSGTTSEHVKSRWEHCSVCLLTERKRISVPWYVSASNWQSVVCLQVPVTQSWAHLEKQPVAQLLGNFSTFHGTWSLITVLRRALHWSLSPASWMKLAPHHSI